MNAEQPTPAAPQHAIVDTPMRGHGNKWQMATVTAGDHVGEDVCIMVEFADGWCVCDMGDDNGMETIRIEDMRLWISVRAIAPRCGVCEWEAIKPYVICCKVCGNTEDIKPSSPTPDHYFM